MWMNALQTGATPKCREFQNRNTPKQHEPRAPSTPSDLYGANCLLFLYVESYLRSHIFLRLTFGGIALPRFPKRFSAVRLEAGLLMLIFANPTIASWATLSRPAGGRD
jgi:hypothetical protein